MKKEALEIYESNKLPILFNFIVVENENCYPMVYPYTINVSTSRIRYKSEELRILEHHTDLDKSLKEFSSIKTAETRSAEAAGILLSTYIYEKYK